MKYQTYILSVLILFFSSSKIANAQNINIETDSLLYKNVTAFTNNFLDGKIFKNLTGYNKKDHTVIDTIITNTNDKLIKIFYKSRLNYAPFRENLIELINDSVKVYLPVKYKNYTIQLYADSIKLQDLIPNYFRRNSLNFNKKRLIPDYSRETKPVVMNISKPYTITNGLWNKNIALWHSHGWYYETKLNRWEWQRAGLFQTIEDLSPMSFTLPFLVPMLENAGANIFLPRERDWQVNEVIVDNNGSGNKSIYEEKADSKKQSDSNTGFAIGNPPYSNENPFRLGTYVYFNADKKGKQSISWIPNIPEDGFYAVYISYHASNENIDDANYTVYHEGGKTEFTVNQQIGGSTWIYLGKFKFKKGINKKIGKVILSSKSTKINNLITADAVRFGGGMGNIERNGLISERPRYQEGARYYLQYAGFPDTLIWKLSDSIINDYTDDYQCRGEWVDYLIGSPSGPTKNRNAKGLGIPIDLSLAFHTDAGRTDNDSVIGTLAIYSTKYDTSYFPNGLSKMASRDLSDIIQTQIVDDIRNKYDTNWVRRGLWNKEYSEAWRPTVPAMLLELFSHQNFIDVRFGAEPQFRFDVSRSIYKGMLKFLSILYNFEYVVQPLPVTHFQIQMNGKKGLILKWKPQIDLLEPTAKAEKYIVYTRINDGDFDNGKLVNSNTYSLKKIEKNKIYSFKVTAINRGGESFPSETLSACKVNNKNSSVLIVNGFDRIGAPAYVDQGNFAGFMNIIDEGVPYLFDINTIGSQYNFNKNSKWLDDDSPGFGASYYDEKPLIIPGNTFNFSYIHGKAIKNAGFSFVSVSDESVVDKTVKLNNYQIIDYLTGEEKTSYYPKDKKTKHYEVYPEGLLDIFDNYLKSGGNLFISGAYIGTDIKENNLAEKVNSILKFKWRTNHASKTGKFYFVDTTFNVRNQQFGFNAKYNPEIYKVEASDAIEPADSLSKTIIRYKGNNKSAAVSYNGNYKIIAFGFPFETILKEEDRNIIMKKVLTFLKK